MAVGATTLMRTALATLGRQDAVDLDIEVRPEHDDLAGNWGTLTATPASHPEHALTAELDHSHGRRANLNLTIDGTTTIPDTAEQTRQAITNWLHTITTQD